MKITKARLLEIINEEVADYAKRLQEEEADTLEVTEESLQEMIGVELEEKKATKDDLAAAIADDRRENPNQMDEVEKQKSPAKPAAKPPAKPAAKSPAKPAAKPK